jgi:hypothetical protein
MALPPLGAIIKGGQALVSAGQGIVGAIKKKQADKEMPSLVDANQRALLNTLKREQRSAQTGTASKMLMQNTKAMQKQALKNAMKFGGRAGGLAPFMGMYKDSLANIQAQARQEALGLNEGIMKMTGDIADRQMDLQSLAAEKKRQDGVALQQGAGKNLQAILTQGAANTEDGGGSLGESLMQLFK